MRGVWDKRKKRNKGTYVRFQAVSQSVQFSNDGELCIIYLPGCHMCNADKSLLYRQRHKQRKGLMALWYLFLVLQTRWKELDVLHSKVIHPHLQLCFFYSSDRCFLWRRIFCFTMQIQLFMQYIAMIKILQRMKEIVSSSNAILMLKRMLVWSRYCCK